jgi:two-component system sensor histidine kinase/response regulator
LLDETCRPMQLQAESKGLGWHMAIRKEVPQICLGDPVRIRQVLSNLMSNALKFTDRGGVTLDVGMVDGNLVRFIVEDTGIGIESAKLDGIFEEFEQADRSTTRRFGGTGLGLAISKKLVELMGGRIGVQSAVGQGSVFWFELATSGNRS